MCLYFVLCIRCDDRAIPGISKYCNIPNTVIEFLSYHTLCSEKFWEWAWFHFDKLWTVFYLHTNCKKNLSVDVRMEVKALHLHTIQYNLHIQLCNISLRNPYDTFDSLPVYNWFTFYLFRYNWFIVLKLTLLEQLSELL